MLHKIVKRFSGKRKCRTMAGIAENIKVVSSETSVVYDGELSPTDLTFDLPGADTSLQELIESELALRISSGESAPSDETESGNKLADQLLESSPVRVVQPVTHCLQPDPSETFIEQERLHTAATINVSNLNVFADTIDLSPDFEPTSPLFTHTPSDLDVSPQYENIPFDSSDPEVSQNLANPLVNLDSDESPITEDASDLEPIPLFTQTITSDHEQSPLTEVNPFIIDEVVAESVPDILLPEKDSPSITNEDVLVVIEPPDDLTPVSDSPQRSPESSQAVDEIENDKVLIEISDPPLVAVEPEIDHEPKPESPSEIKAFIDSVDTSVNNCMREFGVVSNPVPVVQTEWTTVEDATKDEPAEWTTVEDAIKEVQSCEATEVFEPQPAHQAEDIPPLHNNVSETITTTTTTKTVKKKKSIDSGDAASTRTKKTKKTKKSEEKENHISVKSSFSKFDQLQKKTVLHVRSSDASKIQKQFNQEAPEAQGANPTCKSCNKTVFAMEQVKAERSVWHKNCFRCKECSKQLTVDTYQSHEGEQYCKPHFKELFKPKAVVDNTEDEPIRRRKPEMIIRENQPLELPPDVVRASDKADLGLEELSALNVKSRFQVFEKTTDSEVERSPSTVNVKRSPSILSKLAKFQKKGMDIGVTDESLNGVDYEESSSSEDEAQAGEDGQVVKSSKLPERPVSFNKMEDVKRTWEASGTAKTREELRAEHKKEISQIRSRLFQGKQGKMKEMYEQAVAESEGKVTCKKDQDIVLSEKARLLKERFERGEVIHSDSEDDDEKKAKNKDAEDMSVFEAGISKKSRSIFLELDATAAKTQTSPLTPPVHALTPRITERRTSQTSQVSRQVSDDIVRASDPSQDIVVETADVSNKFKFFETYKAPEKERKAFRITPPREGQVKEDSPDREIYRDPNVVRSEDHVEDETIVKRSQTASKMLSLFRQMEEQKESVPDGPKPLKCFTPPPDYKEDQSGSSEDEEDESEEEEESEDDTGIVRASDKIEDEFLKQAQNAARAKALKEKFEHWEPEKQSVNNAINLLESEQESIESTKSLRARFESLKAEQPKEKPRPKVNRFVLQEVPTVTNKCVSCDKTVYPLEKIEVDGKMYHTNCFRCQQCQCKLRMESYTLNNDNLYCLPHFRQLFIAKGNYDEGFGSNQHKRKWESPAVNGH